MEKANFIGVFVPWSGDFFLILCLRVPILSDMANGFAAGMGFFSHRRSPGEIWGPIFPDVVGIGGESRDKGQGIRDKACLPLSFG